MDCLELPGRIRHRGIDLVFEDQGEVAPDYRCIDLPDFQRVGYFEVALEPVAKIT